MYFNQALLGKWLWRFGQEGTHHWWRVVATKYGEGQGGWNTKVYRRAHGCGLWCGINERWESFSKHLALVVGDGSHILFWHDRWVMDNSLKMLYPQLYAYSSDKEACISNVLCYKKGGNDRSWNLRFYRDFHDRELETAFSFLDFIQSRIPRGVRCDSPHWCLNGNGKFDIRSYYNKIRGASISSFPWKGIWGKLRFLKGWPSFCGQQFIVGFLSWIISCLRVSLWQIGVVCVALMRNLWIISSSIVL